MSEYVLAREIVARSVSKTWDRARLEWKLVDIYIEHGNTCLCGHYPISEVCVIQNTLNQIKVHVGNCCVDKFMSLSSAKVFSALKQVSKNKEKAANVAVLELAQSQKVINEWEFNFYMDTWRKRKLTEKQKQKRQQINRKLVLMLNKP